MHDFLELAKIRITFFVGMSAAFGYVLAANSVSIAMIPPVLGIFLLSCSSAAMNHFQEISSDANMHRTSRRPLPSGAISEPAAVAFIVTLGIAGSALTFLGGGATAFALALAAFASYNLVYTPLKKVSPFAVVPGSLVGSFPVMAGWAAAGGSPVDPRLLSVAAFFFIWQIPHFWLLMDMYSQDYERAKFPTLRKFFDDRTFAVLTYLLIIALFVSSWLFLTTGVVDNLMTRLAVIGVGVWLVVATYPIISNRREKKFNKVAFMEINLYVLAVTLVVMLDKVLSLPWKGF